jgi:transcriptional regulator with XRE-family HTH domain
MTFITDDSTVSEWESRLGEQFRALRVASRLDQRELAERAGVSLGAVRNLETGKGSTTKTIIRVARALDRTDWLGTLAPPIGVSPLALLRAKTPTPQRVYASRQQRS